MKEWLRKITAQGRTVFMTSHVLETVERVCDRVAIITRPGKVVWEGDITPLAAGGLVSSEGRDFDTLESLFLHVAGDTKGHALTWI
jgi:ABC-2 type transport system ATP-binding protein